MKTQAQTSSNYKHHNNWKALVDISLNGIGTFVSFLWTDQVSVKELTKCSGLLKSGLELEPGYNNMADRGSDIADILPSGKFYPHFPQANFPQIDHSSVTHTPATVLLCIVFSILNCS